MSAGIPRRPYIRQTSVAAYRQLIGRALEGEKAVICSWMVSNERTFEIPPPWTANEIQMGLRRQGITHILAHKRLAVMARNGMVERCAKRTCLVSGKPNDTWALLDDPVVVCANEPRMLARDALDRVRTGLRRMQIYLRNHHNDYLSDQLTSLLDTCHTVLGPESDEDNS